MSSRRKNLATIQFLAPLPQSLPPTHQLKLGSGVKDNVVKLVLSSAISSYQSSGQPSADREHGDTSHTPKSAYRFSMEISVLNAFICDITQQSLVSCRSRSGRSL